MVIQSLIRLKIENPADKENQGTFQFQQFLCMLDGPLEPWGSLKQIQMWWDHHHLRNHSIHDIGLHNSISNITILFYLYNNFRT